jgi:hypothetical protein
VQCRQKFVNSHIAEKSSNDGAPMENNDRSETLGKRPDRVSTRYWQ